MFFNEERWHYNSAKVKGVLPSDSELIDFCYSQLKDSFDNGDYNCFLIFSRLYSVLKDYFKEKGQN